jgi:putative transposase
VPRRPRAFTAGIFHISAHGSDTRHLFRNDEDREDFLTRLAAVCERFDLVLLSYVLMGNHYHSLISIADARISQALQRLHTEYSRHYNRRHRRTAHLFRAHPLAREIASDGDLAGVSRYVARNPVRAGLVRDPLAWKWSSARAHAGLEPPRIPLAENDLRAAFGGSANWRTRYREQITDQNEESPPERAFK